MPCPFHENQPYPFGEARRQDGVLVNEFQGTSISMLLRHEDVRQAARDWQNFSSAAPFKMPIQTKTDVRSVRQLPLEVDPLAQQECREIAEPFFNRAKLARMIAQVEGLAYDRLQVRFVAR